MIKHILLLAMATSIWGAGFIATKWTFSDYTPLWSNTIRFLLAGIIILPYLVYKIPKQKVHYWGPLICSIVLYMAMQAQTIGLKYTTAGKSGFLTTFYALFTPILLIFYQGDRYPKSFWGLLGFAMLGIAFLCDLKLENFNIGDTWTLLSALLFSIHIIIMAKIAIHYHPLILNGLQCVFVGLIALPFAYFIDGPTNLNILIEAKQFQFGSSLMGFILLALFSSNIAFTIQAYAQKHIAPHIVGLVFLLESIFAAIFGYLFLNELLTPLGIFGCFLVLVSIALIPKFGRKLP